VGHEMECDVRLQGWVALAWVAQLRATASCSCMHVEFVFKEPSSLQSHMSSKQYLRCEQDFRTLVKLGRSLTKMFLGSDFSLTRTFSCGKIFRVVHCLF
jgi:hypothetical protein